MELIETLGVIMSEFNYINGTLHAEEVSLRTVSHEVGTPFYLYSSKTISEPDILLESSELTNFSTLSSFSLIIFTS